MNSVSTNDNAVLEGSPTARMREPGQQPAPADSDGRFLTRAQLARLFGVTPHTITDWVRRGTFPPPLPLGHTTVRWPAEVVEEWVRQKQGMCPGVGPQASQGPAPAPQAA